MNIIKRLKAIKEHFENIDIEEFEQNLIKAGMDEENKEEDEDYWVIPEIDCVCEKCGDEIDIITASRYGDKCHDCKFGIK